MTRAYTLSALIFGILATTLSAQQSGNSKVTVRTQDPAGAPIHGARVVAQINSHLLFQALADGQGDAVLILAPGTYDLSVSASGFNLWTTRIELGKNASRVIAARMEIADTGDEITQDDPAIVTESAVLVSSVSEEPLAGLPSLPARTLRHHQWK